MIDTSSQTWQPTAAPTEYDRLRAHKERIERANDDILRLAHVREFLALVDRHFPDGVPLGIAHAIAQELRPLERAAHLAMEQRRLGGGGADHQGRITSDVAR
jgi:hypothetical protein